MQNKKIYSGSQPETSLYYYQILDDDDKLTIVEGEKFSDCCFRFGSTWTPISSGSPWIGKTIKEIKEGMETYSAYGFTIARRFEN